MCKKSQTTEGIRVFNKKASLNIFCLTPDATEKKLNQHGDEPSFHFSQQGPIFIKKGQIEDSKGAEHIVFDRNLNQQRNETKYESLKSE